MAALDATGERSILELLKERYENEGYTFIAYPSLSIVPSFLQKYRPDAIAFGHGGGIVVQIKGRRPPESGPLPKISERYRGYDHWKFVDVYADDVPKDTAVLGVSSLQEIDRQIDEVEQLLATGHPRAAFLLEWGLLEALLRVAGRIDAKDIAQAKSPRQLVEFLEREGYLDAAIARDLRNLIGVHNALAHGDLNRPVGADEVRILLRVLRSLSTDLTAEPGAA